MIDLVERLRKYGPHPEGSAFRINDEAADEIERLRDQFQHFSLLANDHRKELEAEIERLRVAFTEYLEATKPLLDDTAAYAAAIYALKGEDR